MDLTALEKRVEELEKEVASLRDLEAINRLQKSYGFYLEHWMYEEIIALFADSPDTTLNLVYGIFHGKQGVRNYFSSMSEMTQHREFVHQIMQLSGVVDIDPDGQKAKGRWYGFGAVAMPRRNGVIQFFTSGIYTSEYIKEDGTWKILKLKWNPLYTAPPALGWVKPDRLVNDKLSLSSENSLVTKRPTADEKRDVETSYPSGYIVPFHYSHPVTGKPSQESERNSSLNK